ncbi:MAG: AraC family transcriptional regulator [Bernardetiaceae bacterium]|jgi:AraC-like DNA-binding protein|nr:AraC family transcriptional regulator [Bernardetiaceae bacterium]
MLIKIPGNNKGITKYKSIKVNDWTIIESRVFEEQNLQEVLYTEYALGLIIKGSKRIFVADREITVSEGHAVFMKKGIYFTSEIVPIDNEFKSIIFLFNEGHVKEFFRSYKIEPALHKVYKESPVFPLITFRMDSLLNSLSQGIEAYFGANSIYGNDIMKLKLAEVFLLSVNADRTNSVLSALTNIYIGKDEINLMDLAPEFFLKNLSLRELAKISGRSLSRFKADFKKQFNSSPYKWIKDKRLAHAKFLIENTNLSVTEVCYSIGYESLSHFVKSFKEKYGITPKKAR